MIIVLSTNYFCLLVTINTTLEVRRLGRIPRNERTPNADVKFNMTCNIIEKMRQKTLNKLFLLLAVFTLVLYRKHIVKRSQNKRNLKKFKLC